MTSMLSVDERDAMRRGVIQQREKWMREIAKEHVLDDIQFDVRVVGTTDHMRQLLPKCLLVVMTSIKGTRKHDLLESVIFTPTDWHLLRKCPSPVLMVKNSAWPENASILALSMLVQRTTITWG